MSKERLEEIEREIERSNNATLKGNSLGAERMILDLHEIGRFEWLVKHAKEQDERVQSLEYDKKDWVLVVEQNKRYREAREIIEQEYKEHNVGVVYGYEDGYLDGLDTAIDIIDKALEESE